LYIRNPGAEGPPNLYDHGVVTVATQGLPTIAANKSLGRLVARYDILLRVPREPRKTEEPLTVGHMPNAGLWGVIWEDMTAPLMPGSPIATIGTGFSDWLRMPASPHVPYSPVAGSVAPDSRHLGLLGYISGSSNAAGNADGQVYIVFASPGQRSINIDIIGTSIGPSFSFNAVAGSYLEADLEHRLCTVNASTSTPLDTKSIRYSLLVTTTGANEVLLIKQNVADSSLTCYIDISPRPF